MSIEKPVEQLDIEESKKQYNNLQLQTDKDGFKIPLTKKQIQKQEEQKKEIIQQQQNQANQQIYIIPINEVQIIKYLGNGSSGTVQQGYHEKTNTLLALKVITIKKKQKKQYIYQLYIYKQKKYINLHTDEQFKKQINLELNTLINCDNIHIIKCYGAWKITIALELMDMGTLGDLIKQFQYIPETIIGIITYQVLKGLEHLHKKIKVIHRDIKPSNLLINSQGIVKISDFGVSGKINHTLSTKNSWVGTVQYMSPERLLGNDYFSDTDLWALGITIVELAWGKMPFNGMGYWELTNNITSGPIPQLPQNFSDEIKDFVNILNKVE
ncbi:protein kinase domain protein [Ichthyophthirius multifiliis]|uniref:mitogen-activated protein kinase kinase n=1 Tax=Ichthyophthirius multifiliis TaxID=5932 RepID=G0QSK2_ICHMU|nr:protein kinase domain protein [Ichthyophthirius multifiliis]EGR31801.1 protein kinase domain protein [Ichthyophthirius multifiliis]|eukprot:XP_004035287.1 protein kinase domain protein [Ichthyophthirius multifiliis]